MAPAASVMVVEELTLKTDVILVQNDTVDLYWI